MGRAILLGFYRSLVLVWLTVMPVAVAAAVGFGGSLFTLGWSARLTSPLIVKVLATVGELAVAGIWVAVASWFMPAADQPAAQQGSAPVRAALAGAADRG